jgi:Na+-driven multidrug efflux pump
VLTAIFRGMGDMRFPAGMMILNACLQIPLSICLVLGAFGLPALGVVGAAVSAVSVSALVSLIMLLRLTLGNTLIRLRRHPQLFSTELFGDILGVFAPASLSPLLTVATIVSLTAIVGTFGEKALAGYGIGSRIEFLMIPLIFGLGAAMTSLVGMAMGAGDQARAERIGWIGSAAASVLAGTIGLLLAVTANLWIPVFTQDPEIHAAALGYMRIVAPCFAFMGLGFSLYFASQGAGAMLWPVAATCTRIVVALGGALLLTRVLGLGLEGVYYAAALAMILYGLVIAAALRLGAWRR